MTQTIEIIELASGLTDEERFSYIVDHIAHMGVRMRRAASTGHVITCGPWVRMLNSRIAEFYWPSIVSGELDDDTRDADADAIEDP